ncbi:DUF91 domain-containing protein [Pseudomonas protegens]|uniref:Endonuclease NucS C-terminal domain-containing protein n=2 Tax=Pseudomonas protegens TaxID=380021 RepID=Q4K6S0_PSEF5|nr:endonuclease NucS domain-containing protein [Pseudomonas protegens]AAY94212.1 conserved hypothetical protein [Pseudomonas protegens Pf-5]ASE21608.1 DUF91 domain-containing protein [Pseudomonas protegens]QEZ54709.1 DUF91 domain-containing protein [Pseudomonas protegens]QEZ59093.1 DUF91 domain-containing protein [Pseudomonas protegens]QEZ65995.1 DUF91 domain-containing protein [Pseudomonas protegens]
MSFNESVVRKNIAAFLNLIESGLTLVKEEFFLPNEFGSRGFIDILARDKDGCLVVIEVKISKHSEREAITELFKYLALLKQNMSLKDSEIRLLVISTDWRELLTPFSEFHWNTNYNSAGLMAVVDSSGFPLELKPVELLERSTGRKINERHWLQVYESKSGRDVGAVAYADAIQRRGIKNFVVANFTYEYPDWDVKGYGFYFAQQEESLEFYKGVLQSFSEELFQEISECTATYKSDEDILNEFASASTDMVYVPADEKEIGHPEKIKGYLQNESWTIEGIARYGIFKKDIRLTDQEIINDLCGFSGGSYTWYAATIKLANKAGLNEVKDRYSKCLYHNDTWRRAIRDYIEYFETKDSDSVMRLSIFNSENILETVTLMERHGELLYVPNFVLAIEDPVIGELEIFYGSISVNGQAPKTVENIARKYFQGSLSNAPMQAFFHAISKINNDILSDLGLFYDLGYTRIVNGDVISKARNPRIRGSQVIFDDFREEDEGFVGWLVSNESLVRNISRDYSAAIYNPMEI